MPSAANCAMHCITLQISCLDGIYRMVTCWKNEIQTSREEQASYLVLATVAACPLYLWYWCAIHKETDEAQRARVSHYCFLLWLVFFLLLPPAEIILFSCWVGCSHNKSQHLLICNHFFSLCKKCAVSYYFTKEADVTVRGACGLER